MAAKKILPLAAMERILKANGAKRVSYDAKSELASVLEKIGCEIAKNSVKSASYSGRKTVKADDIKQ